MKKRTLGALVASLAIISGVLSIPSVQAERNEDLKFNQISSLRTDASRHRNTSPLPPLFLEVYRDLPLVDELEIRLPKDIPALFAHTVESVVLRGSAVEEGRITSTITWENLSTDQKTLIIPVNGGLKVNDTLFIDDLDLKVHEYPQRTFRTSLWYDPSGSGQKMGLTADFGIFLQVRSDNIATPGITESSARSRNRAPEPPRELRVSKNTDSTIQINWRKGADHDLSGYNVQVINDFTNISVFEEKFTPDETSVAIGMLEDEITYRLFFSVEDETGLRSSDEIAFKPMDLEDTPKEDMPVPEDVPGPTDEQSETTSETPEDQESEDNTSSASMSETGFSLPSAYENISVDKELLKEALMKLEPSLPSSTFYGDATVMAEDFEIITDEGKFTPHIKSTSRRRLLIQLKRLDRALAEEGRTALTNAEAAKMLVYLYRYERIENARLVQRIPVSPTASREEQSHRRYVYNLQKKGMITPELTESIFYGIGTMRQEDFYMMLYYSLKRLENT